MNHQPHRIDIDGLTFVQGCYIDHDYGTTNYTLATDRGGSPLYAIPGGGLASEAQLRQLVPQMKRGLSRVRIQEAA